MKAREIITDKMEPEERDEILIREPATSRPLPLTQSQEATFETVEKLQAQLEDLVEGEQKDETIGKGSENEKVAVSSANKQTSPVRCKSVGTRCDVYHLSLSLSMYT